MIFAAIQIQWKLSLAVIPLLANILQQIFAHATTAQLLCHVQNFVAINVLESRWEWNKISTALELQWKKNVNETGPRHVYNKHGKSLQYT